MGTEIRFVGQVGRQEYLAQLGFLESALKAGDLHNFLRADRSFQATIQQIEESIRTEMSPKYLALINQYCVELVSV